ncbi:MAG TPA: hypothetical protein VG271_19825 [Beijerinckiaceae bacterium]|nr:hypothetical protein [Beijerinckiaceae bacterium]
MTQIAVKKAVELAKKYVADLFADEGVANLGLEEVDYDEIAREWRITLGFSRPWNASGGLAAALGEFGERSYKSVRISDLTGNVVSVKNREVNA